MRIKFEHQACVAEADFDANGLDIVWVDAEFATADSLETVAAYHCCSVEELEDYTSIEEVEA